MGKERARAAIALGHELAAVYDPDISKARTLAGDYRGAVIPELEHEIPWSSLDAIFVCTPPGCRTRYELAAIEAGVPFFVEKPVAVNAADCLAVRAALNGKPTLNCVGYMNRCRSSLLFARQVLAGHDILGACCHWVGRKYQVGWWLEEEQSGGPLNEQATHAFDLFRFLVGEISAVGATTANSGSGALPLSVACTVNFRGGQLGTIFYSCEAADKNINLRVITARGMLEFAGWDLRLITNTIDGVLPRNSDEDIFVSETSRFLTAVERSDASLVPCDVLDAYQTQLAVDAARESLRTGERVPTGSRSHLEASA